MAQILDQYGGVVTTIETDAMTGDTILNTIQDVGPILDRNKENQNSGHDGYNSDRTIRHLAEVPHEVIHKWMKDDGLPVHRYFKMNKREKETYIHKKLGDPNWRYLKAFWQNPLNTHVRHR